MSTAFIIGNGLSRKDIDLTKLKGTTYGCNALYREFTPDYLFAVDNRMQEEIVNSPLFEKNKFVALRMTREKYPDKKIYPLNIPPTIGGDLVGADAGYNAFKHVFFNFKGDTVYLLGFDFIYTTKDNKANNIYRGTLGYTNEPRKMNIKQNVIKNILYYCSRKRKVKFIRVVEPGLSFQWTKKELDTPTNFIEITVEEFKKDHGC